MIRRKVVIQKAKDNALRLVSIGRKTPSCNYIPGNTLLECIRETRLPADDEQVEKAKDWVVPSSQAIATVEIMIEVFEIVAKVNKIVEIINEFNRNKDDK